MGRSSSRIVIAAVALVLAGCSGATPATWQYGPTIGPTPSPAPTPRPTATPAPTPTPAPSLSFPDAQSLGSLTIVLEGQLDPLVRVDVACEWSDTSRVSSFSVLTPPTIAGETVSIDLLPDPASGTPLMFWRDGHAAYIAGPETGTAAVVDIAADRSNGTIRFTDLAPDPESAEPGPLPDPIDDWIAPFGGDPAYATISGTASWRCGPPPATVPTPGPSIDPQPEPSSDASDPPTVAVRVDGDLVRGAGGCPFTQTIDGVTAGDSCGPVVPTPGDDATIVLGGDDDLVFESTDDDWTISTLGYGQATYAEWIRWRGLQPDTFETVRERSGVGDRQLVVAAPPVGDWVVAVFWTANRGDDQIDWSSYFRVIVEG